jgi:hypothetical protein
VRLAKFVMEPSRSMMPVLLPVISIVRMSADAPTVTVPFNLLASRVPISVDALPFRVKKESEEEPPVMRKLVHAPVKYASGPPEANSQRGPSRSSDVVLLPIVPVNPSPTLNVIPVRPVAAPPMVSLLLLMIRVSSWSGLYHPSSQRS